MCDEIYKVGIYNEKTQETLYPQIVEFVIWENEKNHKVFKVQGLQSIDGMSTTHMNGDGSIEIIVLPTYTIEFRFGKKGTWVTASIKPISSL